MVASIVFIYAFFASAGRLSDWPTYGTFYDLQAEAFRAGQLHLPLDPDPTLLAKPDPFDHANLRLWIWDASLYEGKYFIYWGPVPALLQAGAKMALGIAGSVGDQYLVFAFCALSLLFGVLLIERTAARVFPTVPRHLVVTASLAFGFANPTLHLLAAAGHYQAAIAGAQAFLLAGLAAAFDAVWSSSHGRSPRWSLVFAGVAWALSIGCRVSLLPAIALLCLVTLFGTTGPERGRARRFFADATTLAIPLTAMGIGLLVYNQLRFDAWFEFGVRYQLSTMPYRVSASFVPLNVYSYLLRPANWSCAFPYLVQRHAIGIAGFPAGLELVPGYSTDEPVVGLLRAVPWAWLAPVGLLGYAGRTVARRFLLSSHRLDPRARAGLFLAASFGIIATVTALPTIGAFFATMRYLGDFTNGVVLAGALGAFWLYDSMRHRRTWRALVGIGTFALAAATATSGLLLGYVGYNDHFQVRNRELHDEIVGAMSLCD